MVRIVKMHFTMLSSLVTLAVLLGTSVAMGLSQGNLRRDLKLAAEMGMDPDMILRGGRTGHAIAHAIEISSLTPEYVEVCVLFLSWVTGHH